jgi:ribosome assembly protein YihI (activator of Der GTPase)
MDGVKMAQAQPELLTIIERLKEAVIRHDMLTYETHHRLNNILKKHDPEPLANNGERKEADCVIEEIHFLISELCVINDKSEENLKHLQNIA